jgi:ethanolamine kinase
VIPCCFVDGYPYLWRYRVDWKDNQSIKDVCVQMFGQIVLAQSSAAAQAEAAGDAETTSSRNMLMMNDTTSYDASLLHVQRISGGVTNMLFKVSGLRGIFKNIIPIINVPNSEDAKTATTFFAVVPNDVLVRIFGAEGMINRDDETYYFSILARQGIAPPYFGRFQNGRLEGWMDDMRPLETSDLHCNDYNNNNENDSNSTGSTAAASTNTMIQAGIARALAQLHATNVPTIHHPSTAASLDETAPQQHQNDQQNKEEPTLWKQLEEWYQQACSNAAYKTMNDEQRARELNLVKYRAELDWLRHDIVEQSATPLRVAFCHNDLLAANILYKNSDGTSSSHDNDNNDDDVCTIQLIDFEYGGWNYVSFDIANHWNEHAGGPPDSPHPNYDNLLPNATQRRQFCRVYLQETEKLQKLQQQQHQQENALAAASTTNIGNTTTVAASVTEEDVTELVAQVEKFLMPNHLYWGFWAVNQAATEGCDCYDYLEFAKSRLAQYWVCKQQEILAQAAGAEAACGQEA